MLLKSLLVLCVLFNSSIDGQICRKQTVVNKPVYETYTYTYVDRYTKKNWYGKQVYRTRQKTAKGSKSVNKQVIEFVATCCDGYIRADNGSLADIECTPICMPACENGRCTEPGVCECNEGYLLDFDSPHKCSPSCDGCLHGTCVAPGMCRCDFGYSLQNGTSCAPICTEPCVNSTCVAPDTCQCNNGYRKTDSNVCNPYCSRGCVHGTCTEPETCTCNNGWDKTKTGQCVPKCDVTCGNGTCTKPNQCKCNDGYKVDEEHDPICVPHCDVLCGNGDCVAPDTCECGAGYKLDISKDPVCVPQCDIRCGNGACIAPNHCECDEGYRVDKDSNPVCVPQCDTKCGNGTCVAPNTCKCDVGYALDLEISPACVPQCQNKCGNGTCIAPDMCKCMPGFKENKDREPNCVPDCGDCEGDCFKPGECKCDEPFKATRVTADGKECEDNTDKCTRVVCKMDVTVKPTEDTTMDHTEGHMTYGYDDIDMNYTSELSNMSSNVENDESDYGMDDYDGSIVERTAVLAKNQMQGSKYWVNTKWGYAVISIVTIISVIILGSLVVFRKTILECCKGTHYEVDDAVSKDATNKQPSNDAIRLSAILKKREEISSNDV